MNEDNIITLLRNYQQYQSELSILQDCGQGQNAELIVNARACILKKRLSLIGHIMELLTEGEASVLRLHLVESMSWNEILDIRANGSFLEIMSLDRRALQRTQRRALRKASLFLKKMFGTSLDYLIDDGNG